MIVWVYYAFYIYYMLLLLHGCEAWAVTSVEIQSMGCDRMYCTVMFSNMAIDQWDILTLVRDVC